jgi:hypothetical protein
MSTLEAVSPVKGGNVAKLIGRISKSALIKDPSQLLIMMREIPYCMAQPYFVLQKIIESEDHAAMYTYASCIVYLTGFCARLAHENAAWFQLPSTVGPFSDSVKPSGVSNTFAGTGKKGAAKAKAAAKAPTTPTKPRAAAAAVAAPSSDALPLKSPTPLTRSPSAPLSLALGSPSQPAAGASLAGFLQRTVASETLRWVQHSANLWRQYVTPRLAIDIAEGARGIFTIPGLQLSGEMSALVAACPDMREWEQRYEAASAVNQTTRWSELTLITTLQWCIARDPADLLTFCVTEVVRDMPDTINWVQEPASAGSGSGRGRKRTASRAGTPKSRAATPRKTPAIPVSTASGAASASGVARALLPTLESAPGAAALPPVPAPATPVPEPAAFATGSSAAVATVSVAQQTPTRRTRELPATSPLSKADARAKAIAASPFVRLSAPVAGGAAAVPAGSLLAPGDAIQTVDSSNAVSGMSTRARRVPAAVAMFQQQSQAVSAAATAALPTLVSDSDAEAQADRGDEDHGDDAGNGEDSEPDLFGLSGADADADADALTQLPLSQSLSQSSQSSLPGAGGARGRGAGVGVGQWPSDENWRALIDGYTSSGAGAPAPNAGHAKRLTITPASEARVYCVTHVVLVLSEFGTRPILERFVSSQASALKRREETDARLEKLGALLSHWLCFIAQQYPHSHAHNREIVVEIAASLMILKQNGVSLSPRVLEAVRRTADLLTVDAMTRGQNSTLRNAAVTDKENVYVPIISLNQSKTGKGAMFASYHTHYLVGMFYQLLIADCFGGLGRVNYPNTDGTENDIAETVPAQAAAVAVESNDVDDEEEEEEEGVEAELLGGLGLGLQNLIDAGAMQGELVLPTARPFPRPRALERGRWIPTLADLHVRLNHFTAPASARVSNATLAAYGSPGPYGRAQQQQQQQQTKLPFRTLSERGETELHDVWKDYYDLEFSGTAAPAAPKPKSAPRTKAGATTQTGRGLKRNHSEVAKSNSKVTLQLAH